MSFKMLIIISLVILSVQVALAFLLDDAMPFVLIINGLYALNVIIFAATRSKNNNKDKRVVITGMMVAKAGVVLAFVVTIISAVVSVVNGTPFSEVLTNIPMWTGVLIPAFIIFYLIPLLNKEKKDSDKE